MSQQQKNAFAKLFGEDLELAVGRRLRHQCALFEELSFVRREAQAEAELAYEAWRRSSCSDAYAVYRAAQDRADAAQDQLADCWRLQAA
jgi:hypothetical protein